MGRISGAEAIKRALKKYGGGDFNFFVLKDDNDSATVRFLHSDDTDMDIVVVHKVQVPDDTGALKEKYVECLQEEGCPLCELSKPSLKAFLFLIQRESSGELDKDTIYLWERGPSIVNDLLGYIQKYGCLNNRNYEIVRHGKKGSTKTTYQFFPDDPDKEPIELPKRPDIFGRVVLQWDAEEMKAYVAENQVIERNRGRQQQGGVGSF